MNWNNIRGKKINQNRLPLELIEIILEELRINDLVEFELNNFIKFKLNNLVSGANILII